MNTLYCINCHIRTPRNFADERVFDGIYCERCAPKIISKPPNTGSNIIKPINKESLWRSILENYKEGLYGDPKEYETLLRYWKAMASADYPSASENVKYFTDIIKSHKALHSSEREARWKGAGMGDYYCSLCQHTISGRTKFCPECGAKMDEWEEAEG